MDANRTYVEDFSAAANDDGEQAVVEVDHGPELHIKRVDILIEAGAPIGVTVGTYVGEERVAPVNESIGGGGERIELAADHEMSIGTTLRARWENPTGTARDILVIVMAYREE